MGTSGRSPDRPVGPATRVIADARRRWSRWLADDAADRGTARGPLANMTGAAAAWARRRPTAVDAALAGVVAACTLPQLVYWARYPEGGFGVRLLFTALLVAPLVWRRRFPLGTFAFAASVALVQWNVNVSLAADVVLLIYLYTVASRYPTRVAVVAATVVEVGVLMAASRWNLAGSLAQPFLERVVLLSALVAVALLLGISVRIRRQSLSALTDRAERLERERDQQATIAAAAERTRIAREMHDVVAHSLSVMVTLSDAAALKQRSDPERAADVIRQVSVTGHQALDEMRGLLGVLRTEDDPGDRAPQPGVGQVDALLDRVRSAGLSAELTITGPYDAMAKGVELTVYRIVQEAVTNTLKHASEPTRIAVGILVLDHEVVVDVVDDGAWQADQVVAGGLGLTGMRERVTVHDGSVDAGPRPDGGWRVHARLPIRPDGSRSARAGAAAMETAR